MTEASTKQDKKAQSDRPFVLFKTKRELLYGETDNSWEILPTARASLLAEGVEQEDVFGVKMTVESPTRVVDAKKVSGNPEEFFSLAFGD